MIIYLAVAIVAAIVLANNVMQKAETGVDGGQNAFAAKVLEAGKASYPTITEDVNGTAKTNLSLWGKPPESLASLNDLAAQKDAIFPYLPAKGQRPEEIEADLEELYGYHAGEDISRPVMAIMTESNISEPILESFSSLLNDTRDCQRRK